MAIGRTQWEKIEPTILKAVNTYEEKLNRRLPTMEKLATGAIWKRIWFHVVCLIVNLSSTKFADRLEPYLVYFSRQDLTGTNLTQPAWSTYQRLSSTNCLSQRELRIAVISGFVNTQGTVDIFMPLVRCFAFLAACFIAVITLVFLAFMIVLWTGFLWNTHVLVIAFQLVFFPTLSLLVAIFSLIAIHHIFIRGILPVSVANKLKDHRIVLLRNGVLYEIHE